MLNTLNMKLVVSRLHNNMGLRWLTLKNVPMVHQNQAFVRECKVNLSSEEFPVLLAPLLSLDLSQTLEVLQLFSQVVGLPQQLLNHPILLLLLAFLLSNHHLKQRQRTAQSLKSSKHKVVVKNLFVAVQLEL